MRINTTRNLLLILLGLLGIGAIFGGGALIMDPTGAQLEMPVSMLEQSPFDQFLIPGIILFSVLGIIPLLLILALLKRANSKLAESINLFKDMHWSWTYTIYITLALIIWLQTQMVFLQSVHWLHTFYMLYAIVILIVALLPRVRNQYKK